MSQEKIYFYVGTHGEENRPAEKALEYSIKLNSSVPYEIEFMDTARGKEAWNGWDKSTWYTKFSNFRFAIPELRNFQGRAVYLDVDQIILKDPKELANLPIDNDKGWLALDSTRTDVMVYDCSKFKDLPNWPTIEQMKQSRDRIDGYLSKMMHLWQPLPHHWCCNDGGIVSEQDNKFQSQPYNKQDTCLLHYTQLDWQPWKPYPKQFSYPPHPHPRAESLWWQMYARSLEEELNNVNSL